MSHWNVTGEPVCESVLIREQKKIENNLEKLKTAGYIPIFVSMLFAHILLFLYKILVNRQTIFQAHINLRVPAHVFSIQLWYKLLGCRNCVLSFGHLSLQFSCFCHMKLKPEENVSLLSSCKHIKYEDIRPEHLV